MNEKTDGAELMVAYATHQLQATLSYLFSSFRNENAGLTWSNPFFPVVPGATTGQLALAPDNQFQQLRGTAGYDITPTIRLTGDVAWGRMTQNEAFLAPTAEPDPRADRAAAAGAVAGRQDRHLQRAASS